MRIEERNNSIRPAWSWAGLIAFVLLTAGGAMAQVTFDNVHGFMYVELQDDLVTLSARDVPVRDVLTEIVRQSNLTVVSRAPLDARLTLDLNEQPLAEALARIMRGQSYMLQQARAGLTSANTLWVFSDDSPDDAGYSLSATSMAIEVLRSQLMSDDLRVRQDAIKGLRKLGVNEIVGPLGYALNDEEQKIRVKAIYALADFGGDDAAAILAAGLADEDAWVRAETAYALGVIGDNSAIPMLRHALLDADRRVRESAISAFTDIGDADSIDALAIAMQDTDSELRIEAVEAIRNVGGEAAVQLLSKALQDQDQAVREAAQEAMASMSPSNPSYHD